MMNRILPALLFSILCVPRLPGADELLHSVLSSITKTHGITFTIEYLAADRSTIGAWRSRTIPSSDVDMAGEAPEATRKRLEAGLGDWLVIPSSDHPQVWHLIDRALVTRSPMDGVVSALNFQGKASLLTDLLEKMPGTGIATPTVFAVSGGGADAGPGEILLLSNFTGRLRKALTKSLPAVNPPTTVVQWVAECALNDDKSIIATIRFLPPRRAKAKPAGTAPDPR